MFSFHLLSNLINKRLNTEPQPWEGTGNYHRILASIIPSFSVSKVYYKSAFAEENITAGITDVTFVVTQV
ncbi:MAG: hypothetical protein GT601_16335 [Acidaminobacter sp.]|uniref:hypothetical protein n=1 Tax=Acidaminobacter sp. TaxID=1872102 RepID=UPI0013807ABA|nr:hypothetical protein [Acidaminobacter sp.]MZQ99235.1 hypothetical protein [Acidaminobacter sp.]